MKRILGIICLFLLFASVKTYSQEVHGVETKITKYSGPEYETNKTKSYSNLWFGFSFTNMNSIPVSVDAELYSAIREHSSVEYRLITTKSFTLKSGETYIWKFENNGHFKVNYHGRIYHDVYTRDEPGDSDYGYSISYYVKYKAYKLL
ncbi:MAG: hypothetical protein ACI3Y2_03145 [Candidatus Egerieousia sp.]